MPQQVNGRLARPALRWEYKTGQYEYPLSDVDIDDLYRAVWREGKPQLAVAHTLLQRFAFLASTSQRYKTLSEFLRAYVQPINPLWFPNGKLHLAQIERLSKAGKNAEVNDENKRAEQRVVYAATPREKIPKEYQDLTALILAGKTVSPVPTAQHFTMSFASSGDDEATAERKAKEFAAKRFLTVVPIAEGYGRGFNWFFATEYIPPVVSIGESRHSPIAAIALGVVVLFGVWLWRRSA